MKKLLTPARQLKLDSLNGDIKAVRETMAVMRVKLAALRKRRSELVTKNRLREMRAHATQT